MIFVTGATGHLGRAIIDLLLKKIPASEIGALVRDPAKGEDLKSKGVEIRKGDYKDFDSLVSAFKGFDKLLLISSSDMEDRTGQHINAINAAKEAGVKHIFYTSLAHKSDESNSLLAKVHIDTENYLKSSGLTYTLLRNNFYHEVLTLFIGENVLETGTIFLPAGDGKVAYANRIDLAEATANILISDDHDNKTYNFSGNKSYSFGEVAEIITSITGKKVNYLDAGKDVYRQELSKAGVPEGFIDFFIDVSNIFKSGELDLADTILEKILGHKQTSLEDYLKTVFIQNRAYVGAD